MSLEKFHLKAKQLIIPIISLIKYNLHGETVAVKDALLEVMGLVVYLELEDHVMEAVAVETVEGVTADAVEIELELVNFRDRQTIKR